MRKWVKKHKKRLIAFILSHVLGVGSAFALSCPAFADYPDYVSPSGATISYNRSWWEMSGFTPTGFTGGYTANSSASLLYYSEYSAVADLYVHIIDFLSVPSGEVPDLDSYTLNGQGRLIKQFYIDVFPNSNDLYLGVDNITLEDYTIKSDNVILYQNNSTMERGNSTKYNNYDSFYYRYSRNILVNVTELTMEQSDYVIESVAHFKIYAHHVHADNWFRFNGKIGCNITVSNTGTVTNRFNWLKNDWQYYREIVSAIKDGNQNLANLLQGDDAILDTIETGASVSENRINTVDSVIASVAPSADSAINDVSTVITNNGTFWSSQRNASLFWKEVISNMYDSTITGFLGVGLSIILIIILFIFILRL